jgi:hypothetical protein
MIEAKSPSAPHTAHRPFRRNFLDHQDPFETAGTLMPDYTFAGSYELFDAEPQLIVNQIWAVLQRRVESDLPGVNTGQVSFDDAKLVDEEARRFIVTHTDTRRGTLISINTFFRPYGNHLYFSVRSYVLPPLSWTKLVLSSLFSLVLLLNAARLGGVLSFVGLGFLRPLVLLLVLAFLALVFRKLIRSLRGGDTIRTAIRKQFPKRFDWGTFNSDDVLAFLKANVSLTIRSVADVLNEHGINVQGLLQIIQRIEVNNINTGGGSIVGSIIGGRGNSASMT